MENNTSDMKLNNGTYENEFEDNESEIAKSFNYFDINHTGKVNIDDIKRALISYGDGMTDEEFDKIFKCLNINIDDNGLIDYEEFIKMMKNNDYQF
jgi:Ca2+-binding EF-hand superfamily protein